MPNVSICVATYGDNSWKEMAKRAIASAECQTVPCEVIYVHGETLASARNEAVRESSGEWIVCLDADDQLTTDYVEKSIDAQQKTGGTLIFPLVGKVSLDGSWQLLRYMKGNLLERNFCVIGSMFRREDFIKVGGFDDRIPIFEDWELWLKLWVNGAIIQPSEAIYVYNMRPNSRNQQQDLISEWYNTIKHTYYPIAKQKGLVK